MSETPRTQVEPNDITRWIGDGERAATDNVRRSNYRKLRLAWEAQLSELTADDEADRDTALRVISRVGYDIYVTQGRSGVVPLNDAMANAIAKELGLEFAKTP